VALAATLACGLLGIEQRIEPTQECKGDAYQSARALPGGLAEAVSLLRADHDLAKVLGKEFLTVYAEIKDLEHEEFMRVISPWEREHLLLHV
jgi:glutamine synthetase